MSITRRHFAKLLAASPLAFLVPKVGQASEPVRVIDDVRLTEVSIVPDNVFGTKLEVGYGHAGYYLPEIDTTYVDEYGNWVTGSWLAQTRDSHDYLFHLDPFKQHFLNDEGYFTDVYDINPIYVRGEISGQFLADSARPQDVVMLELQNAKMALYRCFEKAVKDNRWLLHADDPDVPRDQRNFYAPIDLPRFGIEQYDFKVDLSKLARV